MGQPAAATVRCRSVPPSGVSLAKTLTRIQRQSVEGMMVTRGLPRNGQALKGEFPLVRAGSYELCCSVSKLGAPTVVHLDAETSCRPDPQGSRLSTRLCIEGTSKRMNSNAEDNRVVFSQKSPGTMKVAGVDNADSADSKY